MELWKRGFCRAPSHNIREPDGDMNELGAHGLPLISYTDNVLQSETILSIVISISFKA